MELFGYIAGFMSLVTFVPQAVKIAKTGNTNDLSIITWILLPLSNFFWIIYGVHLRSMPMMLTNSITFVIGVYILYKCLKFK